MLGWLPCLLYVHFISTGEIQYGFLNHSFLLNLILSDKTHNSTFEEKKKKKEVLFLFFSVLILSDFKSSAPDCNWDWSNLMVFVLPLSAMRACWSPGHKWGAGHSLCCSVPPAELLHHLFYPSLSYLYSIFAPGSSQMGIFVLMLSY